jgi:hypothetical protein
MRSAIKVASAASSPAKLWIIAGHDSIGIKAVRVERQIRIVSQQLQECELAAPISFPEGIHSVKIRQGVRRSTNEIRRRPALLIRTEEPG